MPIELQRLVQNLEPSRTVLFFGAGSSLPSGSPSAADLSNAIAKKFEIDESGLNLAEVAELAEMGADRASLISCVRELFPKPNPTGGLLNIPLFPWRGVYTTNYDELLERSYSIRRVNLKTITTNYDFSVHAPHDAQPLYKIHGTLGKDVVDGSHSRMILTQGDYDKAIDYRDFIYTRLASDMAGGNLVIVGFSLSDPDIKAVVDKVLSIQSKLAGAGGQVYLLLYQRDENRAKLFEARGLRVAFGGIDEFSEALARNGPETGAVYSTTDDPVQQSKGLSATTIDVKHAVTALKPHPSAMFNGWPATYADILEDLTFTRTITNTMVGELGGNRQFATIIGASGVGKTTAARQIVVQMEQRGWLCWEHKPDFEFVSSEWVVVAEKLEASERDGLLLIDEAHFHLNGINRLVDHLGTKGLKRLRILLVAARSQWQFRFKSITLSKTGVESIMSRLTSQEVDRLIMLVSSSSMIRPLVEATFNGFSLQEKRARLIDRCEADAFVCLRNIFASEKFDDIILREYGQMNPDDQQIYRLVSAMEHSGIRVHRQLVVRLTGIAAQMIETALDNLVDVISEYDVSIRFGVYGWKVRHGVIASIIAKYKYADPSDMLKLFEDVIDNISPTYEIERRTIREICNVDTGLPSIPNKEVQNRLLRKLISIAPGEAVPRHRLIRNLIALGKYDLADTEIRVFKSDIGTDGSVARYQVALLLARATETPGLMDEDRLVIIKQAQTQAGISAERYSNNRQVHSVYCDVGIELLRRTKDESCYMDAMRGLKAAEGRTGDEEMTKLIRTYERRRYEMML